MNTFQAVVATLKKRANQRGHEPAALGDSERPTEQPKETATPGRGLLIFAGFLLFAAVWFAFWPVQNYSGTDCGSWALKNDSSAALEDARGNSQSSARNLRNAIMDSYTGRSSGSFDIVTTDEVEECDSARSDQTSGVLIFGLAGAAVFVVGVLRRYQPPATPST